MALPLLMTAIAGAGLAGTVEGAHQTSDRKRNRRRRKAKGKAAAEAARLPASKLRKMPTDRLYFLAAQALDDAAAGRRVRVQVSDLERGVRAIQRLLNADGRDMQAVASLRSTAGRVSGDEYRRELNRIKDGAGEALDEAAAIIEPARTGRSLPRRALAALGELGVALHEYALEAAGRNVDFAGTVLQILSERVSEAARIAARNGGKAFEEFWGFRAGDPLKWGALGVAGVIGLSFAGLGLLALTPGGQALLVGQSAYFKGAGSFFAGAGKAAAKIAL